MDRLRIRGGRPLRGTVRAGGAKNAALPILASTLLCEGEHSLRNVPDLADVRTMIRLLSRTGAYAHRGSGRAKDRVVVEVPGDVLPVAEYDLVKTMRASVLVLGPLLARWGRARVSLPGGCAIGARPIDQHLKGLAALGAEIDLTHGYVEARARRLHAGHVVFDLPTVTGTENVLMAAVLARGTSVLENCAREPEIVDLADFLRGLGARIEGDGTGRIEVEGVDPGMLRPGEHTILPDRIEAATFAVAAAITGGEIRVEACRPDHLGAVLERLEAAGAQVRTEPTAVTVRAPRRPHPVQIRTAPYPGFPTDMQAQLMALCSVASGDSTLHETIFENRFMHVSELARMGAEVRVDGRTAHVRGVRSLSGAPVMATDLRASASLVLAGLRAEGVTTVHRVYHLDRGYERIERKLRSLGADIQRRRARTP
ncbi:MAG: UDP-N-acetylglucosamine 1-carboxyvinyltransferase [Deltaproteobacteria bacterium]|nr:MAG: UDP-N-acetylglucosamine 1-carboxyvinyltransferase [Deltaproteobacteria bacterium]